MEIPKFLSLAYTSSPGFHLYIQNGQNQLLRFLLLAKTEKRNQSYSPIWSNQKMDKIYKTMVFKTINIREQKTVTPEWRETNWGESNPCPQTTALTELPGHWARRALWAVKATCEGPGDQDDQRSWDWALKRRELHRRENSTCLRILLKHSAAYWLGMHVRKFLPRSGARTI